MVAQGDETIHQLKFALGWSGRQWIETLAAGSGVRDGHTAVTHPSGTPNARHPWGRQVSLTRRETSLVGALTRRNSGQ